MIVDTSALLAYVHVEEPSHDAVVDLIDSSDDVLVISPYVLAEVDYLVSDRHGVDAELAVLRELSGGAWELPAFPRDDLRAAMGYVERYRDQNIGLADASQVILADRYRTGRIATRDRRHFDVLRQINGSPFEVLPDWPG